MEEVSALKIRIKFAKTGIMKYIGHLDLMRFFQKLLRRAEIDLKFSGGFSPHPIMSFASPLGVGLTSNGEYVDIEVNSMIPSDIMMDKLNAVTTEGVRILSCNLLPDDTKAAMSSVAAADYEVGFRYTMPFPKEEMAARLEAFQKQEQILITKKTKKSEQEMDLAPFIYDLKFTEQETVWMKVSSGSVVNIRPEMVLEAFYAFYGKEVQEFEFLIHRHEMYFSDENNHLLSLEAQGEPFHE